MSKQEQWAWYIAWLVHRERKIYDNPPRNEWHVADPLAMTCLAELIVEKCVRK